MKKIKVGVIGTGMRGMSLLKTICACDEAEIVAVCDLYEDRTQNAYDKVVELRGNEPVKYLEATKLINDPAVELVVVSAGWEAHIPLAIESMKAGKITGLEVGGAVNVEECWELVNTWEETRTPIMFMENCCYDKFELLSTSLARAGRLGEIVHCHGAYSHDLRKELAESNINRHYRLASYISRNCDNYPTHELGPIAKLIDINRGNRMLSLVSVASKAKGLEKYVADGRVDDPSLNGLKYAQGDIVNTIITCENGETISLTLDTTLPKYYSREFTVRGTIGMTNQEAKMVYIEGEYESHRYRDNEKNEEKFYDYLPDIWKNITPEELELGHGGMDFLMFRDFLHRINNGEKEMPIDVYDGAAWMCISALTEKSIAEGGMPQQIPDFTKGAYKNRPRKDVVPFNN